MKGDAMGKNEKSEAVARRIVSRLRRTEKDGARKYSDEDIRHALGPVLLAASGEIPDAKLPDPVRTLLGEIVILAGIGRSADGPTASRLLEDYYRRSPPDDELVDELAELLGEEQDGGSEARVRAMSALIEATSS